MTVNINFQTGESEKVTRETAGAQTTQIAETSDAGTPALATNDSGNLTEFSDPQTSEGLNMGAPPAWLIELIASEGASTANEASDAGSAEA